MRSPRRGGPIAEARTPRAPRQAFPALRHREFRRYAVGQGVSLVGFWMQNVAQGWLVYRLSGSELALGVVGFASYLPVLLCAPVAGTVADRVSRRWLILVTQGLAMLLALALGVLAATGQATVPRVAVLAALSGTVGAFDLPARQALLIELVGPEDLAGAIALNASIFNVARVVGPALAGMLVGSVGEAPCFFVNALSYGPLIAALSAMSAGRRPAGGGAPIAAIRSGLAYLRREPMQRALLLALGIVAGVALQANVLMPALAERSFAVGAEAYGLLLTAYGGGAVVSALRLAAYRQTLGGQRVNLLQGLAVFGGGLALVALSPSYELAVAGQFIAGFGMVRYTATTNALVQTLVDDAYRGRIMGLHTVMFMGTAPFGTLLLGIVAAPAGPRPALVLASAVPVLMLFWLRSRSLLFERAADG